MRGLLDTSVFIAREQARALGGLPDEAAVSVMTLAELHLGVLLADSPEVRAVRVKTLGEVERSFDPLPVDDSVARSFASIAAAARRAGRKPRIVDALIAATAVAHGLPVFTQDEDFAEMPEVQVVRI